MSPAGGVPFFLKVVAGTGAVFLGAVLLALVLASLRREPAATTLEEHLARLEAGERTALETVCARAGTTANRLQLIRVWQNEIGTAPLGIHIRAGRVCALRFSGTSLTDAREAAAFAGLESLWLDRNQLTTLPPLGRLRHLRELNIRGNTLAELPELPAGLEVLDAGDNQLSNIDSVRRAASLRQVFLARNLIASAEPLSRLRVLTAVDLDGNRLASIDPLLQVTTLRRLYVRNNPLTGAPPPPTMREGFLEIYAAP